jgi:hypothetical protein
VGHSSTFRVLAACLLVGSAALAQQGLIVEPWPKAAPPVSAPLVADRVMPASGLPPASSAAAVSAQAVPARGPQAPDAEVGKRGKWSPPVLPLLVDPWKGAAATPPAPRPRWSPQQSEIIDPWARERAVEAARVVGRSGESPRRSTIF